MAVEQHSDACASTSTNEGGTIPPESKSDVVVDVRMDAVLSSVVFKRIYKGMGNIKNPIIGLTVHKAVCVFPAAVDVHRALPDNLGFARSTLQVKVRREIDSVACKISHRRALDVKWFALPCLSLVLALIEDGHHTKCSDFSQLKFINSSVGRRNVKSPINWLLDVIINPSVTVGL